MIAWTPNPALDLSGEVAALVPNEKNSVHTIRRDPGGNSINSGRIAHRLGSAVTHVFWSGGAIGLEVQALLKNEKQRVHPIRLPAPQATRTNITVTQKTTRTQTRLSFPGPEVSRRAVRALLNYAKKHHSPTQPWLIGGSLPPQVGVTTLRQVLQTLEDTPVFLDVPGPVLRELCPHRASNAHRWRALLMKPNLQELAHWWGGPLHQTKEIQNAASKLRPYTRWICVSLGSQGAMLGDLDQAASWWIGSPPPIVQMGSVGAGDSMLGAMAWAWERNPKLGGAQWLSWGLAGGAATAASPGTHLGTASLIRKLYKTARVQRL